MTATSEILNGMNYWLGVECLTPSSAPKTGQDDLARTITWDIRSTADLPWVDLDKTREMAEFKGEDSELEWSFVAYCSVIETTDVFVELRELFKVRETGYIEFRKCDPSAAMALTLNAGGFVTNTFFISSLPWAMGIMNSTPAHERFDFSDFNGVTQVHTKMLADFCDETLNIVAKEAECSPPSRPIDMDDVGRLTQYVYSQAKWRPKRSLPLRIQAKLSKKSTEGREKDTNLLNSFYVQDLIAISKEVGEGSGGAAFTAFMSGGDPTERIDLRKDAMASNDSVMPAEAPLGRWPSKHKLVFAQQFAVNTIMRKLTAAPGISSVNGPPGTGKTTLLRDIVAGVIVNRARQLMTYDNPEDAFGRSLMVEGWKYSVYALDEKICGNGIIVASANNGAIENVTKELPARDAIPETCSLRYFEDVSDSVFAGDKSTSRDKAATWGMIAAPLGNKKNTHNFFDRFGPSKPWKVKDDMSPDPFLSLWDAVAAAKQGGGASTVGSSQSWI